MVDLNSADSRKTAEAIGGPFAKANVEKLQRNKGDLARATVGGNTIVLSLDRLQEAVERLAKRMMEFRSLGDALRSKKAVWTQGDINGVTKQLDAYRAPKAE